MKTVAKKSLGQNFLRDPKILEKIAEAAGIKNTDTVVEIGPGEGTLTKLLLERAKRVIAIEKDDVLAEKLKNWNNPNLEIIAGDALNFSPRNFLGEKDYVLVGNIPYYITGEIFRTFLENEYPPKSLTFVIQKEVAERIMARDEKESMLSISLKAYGQPEYGGIIKAGSFFPAPKVDSGIISLRNINKSNFAKASLHEKDFFTLVRKGFSHKRKLLSSNLDINPDLLEQVGLRKDARAENVSVDSWFDIIKACRAAK